MSIAELFESGEKKQHKGHFKNLVLIARADGIVSIEESNLLSKIASHIGLSKEDADQVLANPHKYANYPAVDLEERYARLVNLIEMVNADLVFEVEEIDLLHRYGIALGFDDDKIIDAIDATISGMESGKSEEEIVEGLMKL